ncbi:MAG: DUF732 domain-containing protein [Mycobacterium sp.]
MQRAGHPRQSWPAMAHIPIRSGLVTGRQRALPGYTVRNTDAALGYGHAMWDKASERRTYAQVIGKVKAEFATFDEYQSYLISQAVNELCPVLIWQLRNPAAGYRPAPLPGDG